MQQRADRHVYRMAGVTEKVLPHLESMQPGSILARVNEIEKYDRLARRNYGLSDNQAARSSLDVRVLVRPPVIVAIDTTEKRNEIGSEPKTIEGKITDSRSDIP
jgi:hypothetical protein